MQKEVISEAVIRWMKATLALRGWSARQWAGKAGLDPTTITRVAAGRLSITPSYETVIRLAEAARVPLPDPFAKEVPVYDLHALDDGQAIGVMRAPYAQAETALVVRAPWQDLFGTGEALLCCVPPRPDPQPGKHVVIDGPCGPLVAQLDPTRRWWLPVSGTTPLPVEGTRRRLDVLAVVRDI